MSHITDVKLRIKDLDALAEAAKELGGELVLGKTNYKWYGYFLADSEEGRRVAAERGADSFGKCDHAIKIAGKTGAYEVGVVAEEDGDFSLLYDNFGGDLDRQFGPKLGRLRQEYAVAVSTAKARKVLAPKGFGRITRETLANGSIKLKVRKR